VSEMTNSHCGDTTKMCYNECVCVTDGEGDRSLAAAAGEGQGKLLTVC